MSATSSLPSISDGPRRSWNRPQVCSPEAAASPHAALPPAASPPAASPPAGLPPATSPPPYRTAAPLPLAPLWLRSVSNMRSSAPAECSGAGMDTATVAAGIGAGNTDAVAVTADPHAELMPWLPLALIPATVAACDAAACWGIAPCWGDWAWPEAPLALPTAPDASLQPNRAKLVLPCPKAGGTDGDGHVTACVADGDVA